MPDIQEKTMTQLLAVHPTHPQKRLMEVAAKALQQGQLVVYPTETSYAVACRARERRTGWHKRLASMLTSQRR